MPSKRVLIITTSHSQMGDTGKKTGLWLEELSTPYYALKDAGLTVMLASIKGGEIPFDPASIPAAVGSSDGEQPAEQAGGPGIRPPFPRGRGRHEARPDIVLNRRTRRRGLRRPVHAGRPRDDVGLSGQHQACRDDR